MDTPDQGTRPTPVFALVAIMAAGTLAACTPDLPTAFDAEKVCYEIDGQIYCK